MFTGMLAVTNFASNKRFGLVDTGWRERLERNTALSRN
jgi:hypothetical protein